MWTTIGLKNAEILNVRRSVYAIPYFSSQFLQVDKEMCIRDRGICLYGGRIRAVSDQLYGGRYVQRQAVYVRIRRYGGGQRAARSGIQERISRRDQERGLSLIHI